ncbi:MAG: uncharacterized protein JWQ99_462 [Blastococcus sp.]|nr:uncharacterized protein [Blastococcus sp.]
MAAYRRALMVAAVAAAVLLVPGAPRAEAAARTVTYTVSSQGAVAGNLSEFAAVAAQTFADPRGWNLGGSLALERVSAVSDFSLILASPSVIAAASPSCSAEWSCRVGRNVYINDDRWRLATATWPHGPALYRQYVILHEVGHWLGLGHATCAVAGRMAAVMQQQSKDLQGCRANVWPLIAEREQVGRNMGVGVAWSAIEQKYRAMGQERSVLGAAITWEQPAGGTARYQSFQAGTLHSSTRTGAHETHGDIDRLYRATGGSVGPLGFPVADTKATADGRGRYSSFHGGTITWGPATGIHETHGDIDRVYRATGGSGGPLAYPTGDTTVAGDGVGRFSRFSGSGGGAVFWSPATGAHEIYGPVFARWAEESYERGRLGYPVSGVQVVPGGQRSTFQHGYITYDSTTRQTAVVITG